MKRPQYTIHKFIRVKPPESALTALQVEETEWFSPYPDMLLEKCIELAREYSWESDYLFRHRPTVDFRQGMYPGAELFRSGEKEYTMAWVVVPVIENVALDYK